MMTTSCLGWIAAAMSRDELAEEFLQPVGTLAQRIAEVGLETFALAKRGLELHDLKVQCQVGALEGSAQEPVDPRPDALPRERLELLLAERAQRGLADTASEHHGELLDAHRVAEMMIVAGVDPQDREVAELAQLARQAVELGGLTGSAEAGEQMRTRFGEASGGQTEVADDVHDRRRAAQRLAGTLMDPRIKIDIEFLILAVAGWIERMRRLETSAPS